VTDHTALLRVAEDQLADYRQRIAGIADLIHDPRYDYDTRHAFAEAAGLPTPRKEATPWTSATSPAPANAGGSPTPTPNAKPHAYVAPDDPASVHTAAGTAASAT
jgi:hypothetical protein